MENCMQAKKIDTDELRVRILHWLEGLTPAPKKILILPPDITRIHSKAGFITSVIYEALAPGCHIDIMPALGTHFEMTKEEYHTMFGEGIPLGRFFVHDWREDVVSVGKIPAKVISELSGGLLDYEIDVELNSRILDKSYDYIISIGQVVPHEVVGMSSHNKNIMVGCGGKDMIDKSHFLGAVCGIENILGKTDTPVRRLFDYAEQQFLAALPLQYILTVTQMEEEEVALKGVFFGQGKEVFNKAAALSRELNINLMDREIKKAVVYLSPDEYKTTWLGDKAIYRTRMAIADGGELYIIAPGIGRFGEDDMIDELTRKYGYSGTREILDKVAAGGELRDNLCVAASLIHGATDGRFKVFYAAGRMTREEVEGACLNYLPPEDLLKKYDPNVLKDGFNTLPDGEEIFYVSNPALGLWALRNKFNE